MKQYIDNLIKDLVEKNEYRKEFYKLGTDEFIKHVKTDLYSGDVKTMDPSTLGRIMCSFEIGDVLTSKRNLFNGVCFGGDCGEMLRELVSLCLAYAIRGRLYNMRPVDALICKEQILAELRHNLEEVISKISEAARRI